MKEKEKMERLDAGVSENGTDLPGRGSAVSGTGQEACRDALLPGLASLFHRGSVIYMRRALGEQGADCPPPYLMVIACHEGLSQEELSYFLRVNKGSVARVCRRMQERGYIRTVRDQNNRRRNGLYLTEKGRRLIPKIEESALAFQESLLQGFSDEERERFLSYLMRSRENLLEMLHGQLSSSPDFARVERRRISAESAASGKEVPK